MNYLYKIIQQLKSISASSVAFDRGKSYVATIVLVHGIAATSDTWRILLDSIDLDRYRVIAVDLLGHGHSPAPNCEYTVDDFVKSIHKTIHHLHLRQPFIIVGHSMGSIIAARYGRLYPRQLISEYLLSLPLYPRENAFHSRSSRKYTDAYLNVYDFLLNNKDFTIRTAQRVRKLMRLGDGIDINEGNWDVFYKSLKNTIIDQDTYSDIRATKKLPISIIYGGMDQFLVSENIEKINLQPNVRIKKISVADHRVDARICRELIYQLEHIE